MTDKVRVQLSYDTAARTVGLKLTDQDTGQTIMASIAPVMAMALGDKMFKAGADLRNTL